MAILVQDFQDYANSFDFGYLKTWKATSILLTLKQIPEIVADDNRLLKYLTNCLTMEGFQKDDIAQIQRWMKENIA